MCEYVQPQYLSKQFKTLIIGVHVRYIIECTTMKVLQLVCWHMIIVITHSPLIASNLPIKLWLLGDGQ